MFLRYLIFQGYILSNLRRVFYNKWQPLRCSVNFFKAGEMDWLYACN